MAQHGITLTRTAQENHVSGRTQGYRMTVTASAGLAMSDHIFLYRIGAVDPETGDRTAKFTNICSPTDLAQHPVGLATAVAASGDWYRDDDINLVFRAPDTADDTWDLIIEDVAMLINTLDLMDVMGDQLILRIGATASSSSSSSSSSS